MNGEFLLVNTIDKFKERVKDHKQMFEEAVCSDEKIRQDLTKAFQRLDKINFY